MAALNLLRSGAKLVFCHSFIFGGTLGEVALQSFYSRGKVLKMPVNQRRIMWGWKK